MRSTGFTLHKLYAVPSCGKITPRRHRISTAMGEYMHRHIRTLLAVIMTLGLVLGPLASTRPAGATTTVITLTIGNPNITVNGTPKPIDASGTTPVIVGGRTLLPIRAIVEALGGTIGWNAATRTVTISVDVNTLELVIGNRMATVNGAKLPIDAANATIVPVIVGGRTMLPVRFVGEQLGGVVEWNQGTKTATLTFMTGIELTAPRLLEPTDGALFTSATITFGWTPVTYATSYTLVITSGSKEVYRGVSTTSSFTPSGAALTAGTYSWIVTASAATVTGPAALAGRFTVKLPMSPADIVKAASPSVAAIRVQYADGASGTAAAFFLETAGVFATTYNVIKGGVSGLLLLGDGSELTSLRVVGYSTLLDVAILNVPSSTIFPALALATGQGTQVNQDAVMVGPVVSGVPQRTVAGVVNAVSTNGFTVRGAAENAIQGSPVLDQFGDAIGMVTTDIKPTSGTFPAVSATAIRGVPRTGDWTIREVTDREGTGLQALDAPLLAEPSPEATIGTLTPGFRWNAVTGATRYRFWVGEGRNATGDGLVSIVIDYTDPEILSGVLKPGTVYTWAVRAGNDNGWGPWSTDRMFVTSSSIVQPAAPTGLEPLNAATITSSAPMLFWTPMQGAQQYYVWMGSTDDEVLYETSTTNSSVLIPAGILVSGTTYQWAVRVENSSRVSSLWSPHTSFILSIPSGGGVTSQIAPAPKQLITTLNPTFSWQPVPGATRYDLWIDKVTSDTKVYEIAVDSTSWTIPAGSLQPGATYWWSVIAGSPDGWSKSGTTWNWSLDREFTVGTNAVATLVPPRLQEPADRAALTTLTPPLSWQTVTAAAYYRVFIGIGPDDKHLEQIYLKVVYPKAGETQQLVVIAGTLQAGTTYWWRVLAASGDNAVASDFRTFTSAP